MLTNNTPAYKDNANKQYTCLPEPRNIRQIQKKRGEIQTKMRKKEGKGRKGRREKGKKEKQEKEKRKSKKKPKKKKPEQ